MRRLALIGATLGVLFAAAPASAAVCQLPLDPSPPDAAALNAFALLRSPTTPSDGWPKPELLPSDTSFNQRWFHRAGALGGYSFFLLPAHQGCSGPSELWIAALGSPSTVNGAVGVRQAKRFGFWFGQGFSGGSIVAGLLPDGVARVRVTIPKGRGHPGGVSYRGAVRRTVRVRNNMALLRLGRPPADATPSRQVWFSKSGRVIRRAPGNP